LKIVHLNFINMNYVLVLEPITGDRNFEHIKTTDYVGNKIYEDNQLKRIYWNANYRSLCIEMKLNKPIYDSYIS